MSEGKSYIIKKRDFAEIIRTENSSALEEFLKDPLAVIAGAITEGLANGSKALVGPAVRIAHSVLRGKLLQQFAQETKELQEKGKLANDFAERKYGYATWVDLLTVIDREAPDEERLEALRAMFYSANKVNATDGEQIAAYQLFQIAKRLNSNELLVLKTVYSIRESFGATGGFRQWAEKVCYTAGHGIVGLVELADNALVENGLLTERQLGDRSGINAGNGRLTDLGLKFCDNIERYQIDKKS
jgi:hypothetical protein